MKTCYFVIGMHRSGTSAIAGLLASLGVYPGDELLKASASNKKGYFENTNVYELNKKILSEAGSSWNDENFVISSIKAKQLRIYSAQAKKIIEEDFKFIDDFLIKDPRICLLFPIWEKALKELKIKIQLIYITRNPIEVALSIKKRNKIPKEKSLILWAHHYFQIESFTKKYKKVFLSYDDLLNSTSEVLDRIVHFTGLVVDENEKKEAVGFVSKNNKNNRLLQFNAKDVPEVYGKLHNLLISQGDENKNTGRLAEAFYTSVNFYKVYKKTNLDLIEKLEEEKSYLIDEKELLIDELDLKRKKIISYQRNYKKLYKSSIPLKGSTDAIYTKVAMNYRKQVDIVIPVFNALEYVKGCVESILASKKHFLNNVIIINDGSEVETRAYLRELEQKEPLVILVDNAENQGYTTTVNTGISKSTAPYVVLLNSDTVVSENWLDGLIRCAENDDKVGVVGPLSNAASWQSVPELFDAKGKFLVNELGVELTVNQMSDLVSNASIQVYPKVSVINGFCFLITRSVIDKIGLMDADSFPIGYGEENDYCIRARNAGFDLVIADDVYVYHAKSKSFGVTQRDKLSSAGAKQLREKHGIDRIDSLVTEIKDVHSLAASRTAILDELLIKDTKNKVEVKNISILFILPSPGAGGGSHSIVQEVFAMQELGIKAVVGLENRNLKNVLKRYKDIEKAEDLFVGYDESTIMSIAKEYDVVVATIFYSVDIVKNITKVYPHILPAYYVQDYEPMFFTNNDSRKEIAERSYELVEDMLLFAKTYWIARQVAINHGVSVKKVAPSIDHSIYFPTVGGSDVKNKGVISLSAMIRPQTAYRGAPRTMELLTNIKKHLKDKVEIQIFGCNDSDENFKELAHNFDFVNLGIINRSEVAFCLKNSDIFIDLSDYQAFGRTSLEAMACGCAAMLPCHGGGDEYAVDNYNSLVVDTFDEDECYIRLLELIDDTRKLEAMKKAGIETASRYSPRRSASNELELFSNYLSVRREKFPKKEKHVVCVVTTRRNDDKFTGSSYVRLIQPFVENIDLRKKWEFYTSDNSSLPALQDADIVVIQRDAAGLEISKVAHWLSHWRLAGKKFIFELDDDLFDAVGLSARTDYSKEKSEKVVGMITWLATNADAVIVSTPQLYQLAKIRNENVFLLPNSLDSNLWGLEENTIQGGNATDDSVIKIGYIGTPTHNADLELIKNAINKIQEEYGAKVEVEVIGAFQKQLSNPIFGASVGLPKDTTYPAFVDWLKQRATWDIALIPLIENNFNMSKSYLKYLECSALGLACICSDIPVYSSIVKDMKTGLLVDNKTEAWYQAIKSLIDNPNLRKNISNAAHKDIVENHTVSVNTGRIESILSDILLLPSRAEMPAFEISLENGQREIGFIGKKLAGIASTDGSKRLVAKFVNNPHRYFSDSKHIALRPLKFFFKKK